MNLQKGSLRGLQKLIKKTRQEHSESEIAQMFKPVLARDQRKKFEKIKCYPKNGEGRPFSWQGDLAVFTKPKEYSHNRKEYSYLLLWIDCFSRKLFHKIIDGKSIKDVLPPTMALLAVYKPKRVTFDRESAITSLKMKEFLMEHKITLYHPKRNQPNKFKGATMLIERAIRTIKSQIFKHQQAFGGDWKKHVDKIIKSYNDHFHRSIKMTPNEAWESNETFESNTKEVAAVPLGTRVRVRRTKKTFEKGTTHNWSKEVFFVSEKEGLKYRVKTKSGQKLLGVYGPQDLQIIPENVISGKLDVEKKVVYEMPRGPRRSSRLQKKDQLPAPSYNST